MLSISQQRAIWMRAAPELGPLLAPMPELEGNLSVYHSRASSGLLLAAMLTDAKPDEPQWWWHQSLFVPVYEASLPARLEAGFEEIERLSSQRITPCMPRTCGPNVIPFANYRRPRNEA